MAFAGWFLDGEGALFGGGSGAQGAGGGAARRAQPAAAGFACAFALRAKGGSAVVGAGRGLPRRAGRPAGRAASPHDAPPPPPAGGGGLRPSGAERLPAVCLRQGGIWGGGYACAFWRFCQRR